jgi:hypothetical protein
MAILPFRIEVESVTSMFDRRNFITGSDEFGNDPFYERGLSAVRFADETDDGHSHITTGQPSIVISQTEEKSSAH